MTFYNGFSSFLIGTESILIRCAEILLQYGNEISGISSNEKLIIDWASEMGIPVFSQGSNLVDIIRQLAVDYLFSIVYPKIIPNEILALPSKGAINFHDGPLPKYAGMNATSWAIMNQEKSHGVTWHFMSAEVDKGQILKQHFVDIDPWDTSLTLNSKCYEAGISAFSELVEDLVTGTLEPRQQNLNERTYFAKYKRPPALCTISWSAEADEISALVRGLHFGTYNNVLGLPKFMIDSEIVIVQGIEVLDIRSQLNPGTIVGLNDDHIGVTTSSNDVAMNKLQLQGGPPLSIRDFIDRYNLHEGDKLTQLDQETAERLTSLNSRICRNEALWVNKLKSVKPYEMPYSSRYSSCQDTVQFGTISIPISSKVDDFFSDFSEKIDRSNFLIVAFAAFLSRISDMDEFTIGFSYPTLKTEVQGIESFFTPYVPLHVCSDRSTTFNKFLVSLQEEITDLISHETYACDIVMRYQALRSIQTDGCQPQWTVVAEKSVELDGCIPLPGSKLSMFVSEDGSDCRWAFDLSIIQMEDVNWLQRQFTTFIENVIQDSSRSLGDTPILSPADQHEICVEWNNTHVDYPHHICLHQLFEEQVGHTPDAVAVRFENSDLTYQQLNHRANQLAHRLIKLGVTPEVLVGVYLERSLELVIALYGILKAGGAYVPLDQDYPQERITFMLEESQVPVLLTQQHLASALPKHNAKVICLDSDWDSITSESTSNPESSVMSDNLAYVIYTSGSTGKPKGVMNTHLGIVNRLLWMQDEFSLTETDRILQKTPYSFDVSVWEFFWPLSCGARLIIAQPGGHKDSSYLIKTIIEQEITTIHFVPSMLQIFLKDKDVGKCQSLRRVICSGEALPFELQKLFFSQLDAELYNLYGPTEAAVDVSCWKCQKDSALEIVPIGRPIANTQLYILDSGLNPVPVGILGELHIGGVQVARGYLDRPELTAEKFIPNPFSADPKSTLYKTGDLVRFLPDGNIAFSGRMDHQVKLRGFRIELGEIETVLCQHQDIVESVVLAREDMPGDTRLVVYFSARTQSRLSIDELRDFLKEKLPEYMVPAAYVQLKALPLTPNGKVDRRALPTPDWKTQSKAAYLPPEDEWEKIIAEIWQDVLKIEQVSVKDNFFELGGHSLLLALVYNQLRDRVDKELSLTDLFRFPTIRTLSQYLSPISDDGDQHIIRESADRAKARRATLMRRKQHRIG
jgi:amino acid adenylation domain-containing protein